MKKNANIEDIRHSLAHLLAMAVIDRDPQVKLAIGPSINSGFYYDFEFSHGLTLHPNDLPALETHMEQTIAKKLDFERMEVSADEARKQFKNQPYKLELIDELEKNKEKITLYKTGNFVDLCRGGHVANTGDIDPHSFTLSHIAGAYWRGDEKNTMLSRLYGLAYKNKGELDAQIAQRKEAKERDHRKLGKELELYTITDEVGPGLPLFYPKGALLRRLIENYIIEEQERRGYEPIWIPHITKGKLYEISGHLDKYDAMFPPMELDGEDYYLKPMNCPHFMMLYKSLPHSYRNMPVRYTATTSNYRYEKSGELNGLTRVRSLTQDDCHVFCTESQVEAEIEEMLDMVKSVYSTFGFEDFWVSLSLRDSKNTKNYIGEDDVWKTSEDALRSVVKKTGWQCEEIEGEAAFYGPKLDFMMRDVIGREWQLSTIQLDFNLPERFNLEYVDKDGDKKRPVVIHRAILGSTERFLAILIEHFAGAFPLWLSPVQVKVLPIGKNHQDYANKVVELLREANIRTEVDESDETLGKKIRATKLQKAPYFLVIGDREVDETLVSVESREKGSQGPQKLGTFIEKVTTGIDNKE